MSTPNLRRPDEMVLLLDRREPEPTKQIPDPRFSDGGCSDAKVGRDSGGSRMESLKTESGKEKNSNF